MGSSRFVVRIGGLAMAFGVGAAVALNFGCAVSVADTDGSSSSSSSSSSAGDSQRSSTSERASHRQQRQASVTDSTNDRSAAPTNSFRQRQAGDRPRPSARVSIRDTAGVDIGRRAIESGRQAFERGGRALSERRLESRSRVALREAETSREEPSEDTAQQRKDAGPRAQWRTSLSRTRTLLRDISNGQRPVTGQRSTVTDTTDPADELPGTPDRGHNAADRGDRSVVGAGQLPDLRRSLKPPASTDTVAEPRVRQSLPERLVSTGELSRILNVASRSARSAPLPAVTAGVADRIDAAAPVAPIMAAMAPRPSTVAAEAEGIVKAIPRLLGRLLTNTAATDAPEAPNEAPVALAMLAFARREVGGLMGNPASLLSPVVGQQSSQTGFTGEPSLITRVLVAGLDVVGGVTKALGIDIGTDVAPLIAIDRPPLITSIGLAVQRDEFEGMPVYRMQSPISAWLNPAAADDVVVAVHGGAYVVKPTVLHWVDYSLMAWATGATVVVPIYPLATEGGTAGEVVPRMARLISAEVRDNPNGRVSVYGDSAGGGLALAAVQVLAKQKANGNDEAHLPASIVLISPWLDTTMSNPDIAWVNDPLLDPEILRQAGLKWAGDLDPTDPMVSPVYGSLEGLPPTYVYSGSLDVLAPDVLVLRDNAERDQAPVTFILRNGLIHDWALIPLTPEGIVVLPDIYRQLLAR